MRCAVVITIINISLLVFLGICDIVIAHVYYCDGLSTWSAVTGFFVRTFCGILGFMAALCLCIQDMPLSDRNDIQWFIIAIYSINSLLSLIGIGLMTTIWETCATIAYPLWIMGLITVILVLVLTFIQVLVWCFTCDSQPDMM